jgi:HAD superfamily hydrolase (TIGR01509 family)
MKAVLWDLDDTILNTLPGRMEALKHAYEECVGGWVDPLELWKSHRGGSLEALGQRLVGDDYRRFAETYRKRYYSLPRPAEVFAGVRAVLDELDAAGIMLGIVTSKISWGATEELERAGVLHLFRTVVGCDDTDRPKPDPEPIFEAMRRIVVDDVEDVVFVGDSPADMFAARNAGCMGIAATWGTLDLEWLMDAGPAHVAREPAAVLDFVRDAVGGLR